MDPGYYQNKSQLKWWIQDITKISHVEVLEVFFSYTEIKANFKNQLSNYASKKIYR